MAAVTQTIPSFLGGVSTQSDKKKFPGQVREAINVFPDPTLGMLKRPGLKFIKELTSTTTTVPVNTLGKWFYINRDDGEKYIGMVNGTLSNTAQGSDGKFYIWNAVTGAEATVTYGSSTESGATDTQWYLKTLDQTALGVTTWKDCIESTTVQDTTYILNKARKISNPGAETYTDKQNATIRLHSVEYSSDYKVTINGTTVTTVQTRNADQFSNAAGFDTALNADDILTSLKTNIDAAGISNLTVHKLDESLELEFSSTSTFTELKVSGGIQKDGLSSFIDSVDNISKLPDKSLNNRRVKVTSLSGLTLDYYAKFETEDGQTSGKGSWVETKSPHIKDEGFYKYEMPHKLVNTGTNAFTLDTITWDDRLVGDNDSNPFPSFVSVGTDSRYINHVFFHNNRLGFLSGDNVIMSQAGDFYNFFYTSAVAATAADPIDISANATKPVQLESVLPAAAGLLLFSNRQQFLMYSESGNLTPTDSIVNGISNYEMETKVQAANVGNYYVFVAKSAGYSKVFSYIPRQPGQPPQVLDISKVVYKYIPAEIEHMVSSAENNLVGLYGSSSDTIYWFRTHSDGGDRDAMQAWFKWKLPGNIHFSVIDNDIIYFVLEKNSKYWLLSANITDAESDSIITNIAGNKINPHFDFYAQPSQVTYANGVNSCELPWSTNITGLTGVVVVKGTISNSSTDDGDFVRCDPVNDAGGDAAGRPAPGGGGPYTLELTSTTDYSSTPEKLLVGYAFDCEVELPTVFFQQTPDYKRPDFTASLTISRMHFALGETNDFSFKIIAKGLNDYTENESNVFANYYLANDVTIDDSLIATLPVYQRNENFTVKITSSSPYPLALESMTWEGNYSPKYYRRA